ncbi:MAG: DUF3084 domain-containing protein [Armatimonadota bacterium]|nr:DUF3084 domain-containing protein [Armatimonadota bacterium]MDW8156042.1 DUF3084 domain-containing protein [Armatimonadota bacterium]
MDVGFLLVPLLAVASGFIAWVGNAVGRRVGKNRLSLFGLRPRTTAQIVTVVTGVFINLVTVGAVLAFSREARVALFELRQTLDGLEERAELLRAEIRALEQGDIALLRGQEVARGLLDGRRSAEEVRQAFFQLRQEAVEFATAQGAGRDPSGNVIVPDPPGLSWDAIERIVRQRQREVVVRLVSTKNVLAGSSVPVTVQVVNNDRVFRRGQVLAEAVLQPAPREAVRQALLSLAASAVRAAEGKILSAPGQRVAGPPFVILDLDSARRATDRVERSASPVRVRAVALQDAYTVGPLLVGFEAR